MEQKIIVIMIIAIVVLLICVLGYFGYKHFAGGDKATGGDESGTKKLGGDTASKGPEEAKKTE